MTSPVEMLLRFISMGVGERRCGRLDNVGDLELLSLRQAATVRLRSPFLVCALHEQGDQHPLRCRRLHGRALVAVCGAAGELQSHKRRQQEHEAEPDQTLLRSDLIRDPAEA